MRACSALRSVLEVLSVDPGHRVEHYGQPQQSMPLRENRVLTQHLLNILELKTYVFYIHAQSYYQCSQMLHSTLMLDMLSRESPVAP